MTVLFLFSMGVCFFTVSLFRIIDVKMFLLYVHVLTSVYCIIKKRPNFSTFSFSGKAQQLAVACTLECFLFIDFSSYILHVSPAILQRFPFSPTVSSMIIAIACCALSFLFLFESARFITDVLDQLICIAKLYKHSLVLLSSIFLVGMTAITRADFSYYDDIGRVVSGLEMTGSFSRHTSTFLSNFLHGNIRLPDISPLPQIIAVLIIAFTGILLLYIFDEIYKRENTFDIGRVISLVPLCFSPYFLQCISYKFDSPYMAISLLFSILPAVFCKASAKKYISVTTVCTILMCTTYQASSGIFPILVILISFLMWNQKDPLKDIGSFILRSVCGYCSGLLIFRFLIMTNEESYIDSTISFQSIPNNLSYYFTAFLSYFTPIWITLTAITCIVFIITMIKNSTQKIMLVLPLVLLTVGCMVILSFGVYIVFSDILLAVRSMYGICVCITLLGVVITTVIQIPIAKLSVFLFSWLMFIFTLTYGNALSQQKEYIDFRLEEVIFELHQVEDFSKNREMYVQIIGSIGHCDPVKNLSSEYKVIESLVPVGFSEANDMFGYHKLLHYYKLNLIYDENIDMTQMNLPIISDTAYHTIKSDDNLILIYLK